MKIAVSSYSFQRLIREGQETQLSCIRLAKELGYEGIEFTELTPHDGSSPAEYAKKIARECERYDLPVTNYTVGADFLTGSAGALDAEVERVKQQVDIAQALGTASMRHDATTGFDPATRKQQGFMQALPRIAEGCRRITEYAAAKGIRTMIENHGFFCQDSARVEQLVNTVENPNFGLLLDMGNFLCADEAPEHAFGVLAPYAFYLHAKDFHVKKGGYDPGKGFFQSRGGNYLRGAIIGHGDVPVRQCLAIMKRNGYDGYVGVEFEGIEENRMALAYDLENLKRMLESLPEA